LLSKLVLNHTFANIFLDYEKTEEEASKDPDDKEVYYEKRDLSKGLEGEDYGTVIGTEGDDRDRDAYET
jgi:hypothetical protein